MGALLRAVFFYFRKYQGIVIASYVTVAFLKAPKLFEFRFKI